MTVLSKDGSREKETTGTTVWHLLYLACASAGRALPSRFD